MASTPMDIDDAPPAGGTPSLNITRTLGANVPSTASVNDVIASFRPTKVGAYTAFRLFRARLLTRFSSFNETTSRRASPSHMFSQSTLTTRASCA
jgi:hypothetical protein